jgi:hypothetical protein
MTSPRVILALALADFRERSRRYSFLVTLLFAVYMGYAAARGQISLRLGDYRGLYTSAWIGVMMSLITTTFLSLVGFYIVKNAVDRDRQTGVGEVLASTRLSRISYLFGKFFSNFAVLASMVVVLAVASIAMQFLVAEDRAFHPWALLSPFLLLAVPAMALTASFAVFFETVPGLRGGFGNVAWFFLWVLLEVPGDGNPRWDPWGLWTVFQSLAPAARATLPGYKNSFSLTIADTRAQPFPGFHWDGIDWTASAIFLRVAWIAAAVGLVLLAAMFFDRFDSARSPARADAKSKAQKLALEPASTSTTAPPPVAVVPVRLSSLPRHMHGHTFPRMYAAELRLALKGYRWWWYAVAAGLLIAQFASPLEVSRGPLLTAAWIWPVLIWSAMGSREKRFGTEPLLFSSAHILPRQLPAAWLAGATLAAVLGAGAAVRLALAGQLAGLLAWTAGVLFVPSLALALGVWTGTSRFFEGLYTALWYVGPLNRVPGLDFTGAGSGPLAARYAWIYLVIAACLPAAAFVRRARQLRGL